jgi:HEAT repeat protein
MINEKVVHWLREAPFDDREQLVLKIDFSYEDWFDRGRAIPDAVDTLIELLEKEDPENPSGDGMRVAYALGWIGDRRRDGIDALLHSLASKDVSLRVEAAAALGRLGAVDVVTVLEKLVANPDEDINVRANACIAVGQLGVPSSAPLLLATVRDANRFLAVCAEESLRQHAAALRSPQV